MRFNDDLDQDTDAFLLQRACGSPRGDELDAQLVQLLRGVADHRLQGPVRGQELEIVVGKYDAERRVLEHQAPAFFTCAQASFALLQLTLTIFP